MASEIVDELYFPFNAPERKWDANDFANYFGMFIGNGVYPNPSNNLKIDSIYNNMTVTLRKGTAFINGHGFFRFKDLDIIIENASSTNKRIDIIVLCLNKVKRLIEVLVRKGVASVTPVVPDIIRSGDFWELKLAEITVNPNTVIISQANIKDTRQDGAVCGIVSAVVQSVDTTELYNQYNEAYKEFEAKAESEIKNLTSLASSITAKVFTTNEFDIFLSGTKKIYTEKTKLKVVEEKRIVATNELVATRTTEFHKPSKGFSTETTVTKKFKFMQPNGDVIQTTDSVQTFVIDLKTGGYVYG